MAEVTKYQLITNNNNNNIITDIKNYFTVFKLKKSTTFILTVLTIFLFFTLFLAFSPSSAFFTVTTTNSNESSRSYFSSFYSYVFPNTSQTNSDIYPSRSSFHLPFQNSNKTRVFTGSNGAVTSEVASVNNTGFVDGDTGTGSLQNSNKTRVFTGSIASENGTVTSDSLQNTNNSRVFSGNNASENGTVVTSESLQNTNKTRVFTGDNASENGTVTSEVVSGFRQGETGTESLQNSNKTRVFSGSNATVTSEVVSVNNTGFRQGETGAESSQNSNKTRVFTGNNASENATVTAEVVSVNNTVDHQGETEISQRLPPMQQSSNQSSTISPQILSKNQDEKHEKEGVLGENLVEKLVGCDLYDGGWVRDESYPLYKPGSCKLIDEQFNCVLNGRLDNDFYKLKWKPKACSLPRLNATDMLKLLKGKRLVFVGDSLNRNMWESLVCILKTAIKNKKKVYETFGRHHLRTEASYSFKFKDYKCSVEFFVAPFLVQQWEVTDKNGATKETLLLDRMVSDADQYKSADYIVFNTGHWWTHFKTSKGEDYYQEGNHVYKQLDVTEAFRRAITTWSRWVDANINPQKTHVLFRGYSASHFRGGQWNAGGKCDGETEPIKNDAYLTDYPWKMKVFESVIKEMKTPLSFLNVTRLTDYRKDAHPSVYRKHHSDEEKKSPLKYQDCSHWCLPGVPDSWNELLYAELLRKEYIDNQHKNKA